MEDYIKEASLKKKKSSKFFLSCSTFDRKGTRFYESRGKHYSSGYGEGDTLGFLIVLPDAHDASHIPNTYKDRVSLIFISIKKLKLR